MQDKSQTIQSGDTQKIGISAWSFNRRFRAEPPTMDYPQFFQAVRELGVSTVELNSPFFNGPGYGFENHDAATLKPDYIQSLKVAADNAGVKIHNIAIDDSGFDWKYDLTSADDEIRQIAIERTIAWMEVAVALGCPHVRNNTRGLLDGPQDELDRCTDSFLQLARAAQQHGIFMVIENHGGISSNPDKLVSLMETVKQDPAGVALGTIPDFGNWAPDIRAEALAKVAPFAKLVHPKMHDFDSAGNQPEWDTAQLVNIIKNAGFHGVWMIEFEGKEDEWSGLQKSIALLSKCLQEEPAHV